MKHRRSKVLVVSSGIVACYVAAFFVVRHSHTKWWFDKSTEERGAYTFFDTNSSIDTLLHVAFRPFLILDERLTYRPFVRDKW